MEESFLFRKHYSRLSADAEAQNWTYLHDFRQVEDHEGLLWNVNLERWQKKDPSEPYGLRWMAHIFLHVLVQPGQLVAQEVLHAENDARMLCLLGDTKVPLILKICTLEGATEQELERNIEKIKPAIKDALKKSKSKQIKREQVLHFLDQTRIFGNNYK